MSEATRPCRALQFAVSTDGLTLIGARRIANTLLAEFGFHIHLVNTMASDVLTPWLPGHQDPSMAFRMTDPIVGVTKSISSVLLFSSFFRTVETQANFWISRLYLTGVAAAHAAAVTTVKYECDSKNITDTFARSEISLTDKSTNGALVTPTPSLSRGGFEPSVTTQCWEMM